MIRHLKSTSTALSRKWWECSALIWHRPNQDRSSYWQLKVADNDDRQFVDEPGTLRTLSYRQFLQLTAALTLKLRGVILQHVAQDAASICESRCLLSVAVAVSIPEGPFLPLAITAVHSLNVPFTSHQGLFLSVVLLPLDASDGRERLLNMLHNARPTIIVTASDCDFKRMEEIASEIPVDIKESVDFTDAMYRSSKIHVIDLRKLLREELAGLNGRCSLSLQRALEGCNDTDSLQKIIHDCTEQTETKNPLSDDNLRSSNRISHIVFTSGSTGQPKGCLSSNNSLQRYLISKNQMHEITCESVVLLASALSFDPCLSDILATFTARATLALAPRSDLVQNFGHVLHSLSVTHVLCTPTLWSTVHTTSGCPYRDFPRLRVVALGGERIPKQIVRSWARLAENDNGMLRLCATFGVTEACVYQTYGEVFSSRGAAVGQDVGYPFPGNGHSNLPRIAPRLASKCCRYGPP
jgi:acyl-CoA synthetase (AMP-forming)/AMP-acid ligase II